MADNFRLNIGSLRSDVKLTLHTHHAARIWMGRPKNDLKAGIIGPVRVLHCRQSNVSRRPTG